RSADDRRVVAGKPDPRIGVKKRPRQVGRPVARSRVVVVGLIETPDAGSEPIFSASKVVADVDPISGSQPFADVVAEGPPQRIARRGVGGDQGRIPTRLWEPQQRLGSQ